MRRMCTVEKLQRTKNKAIDKIVAKSRRPIGQHCVQDADGDVFNTYDPLDEHITSDESDY